MAKEVVKNASLLIHSKQLASNINKVEFTAEGEAIDATNFASAGWKEVMQGIRTTALSCEAMLEGDAEPEKTLYDLVGNETSVPFTVTKTYPPVAGDTAWFTKVVALYITLKAALGQLWGGSLNFGNQGHATRGKVLEVVTRTSTGNSAALNMPAVAAAERMWIAVHVTAASGTTPTLDLVLQSDDDPGFASPTARITVPQITAVGSYISYVAGPVTDDEWRIAATVGGTTPSFTYLVAIGITPTA